MPDSPLSRWRIWATGAATAGSDAAISIFIAYGRRK
jgi:hypothetical protein